MQIRFLSAKIFSWLATLAVLATGASPALAQAVWPERPVKIVVPYPAGGLTDVITRVVAEGLGKELKQPVVVENRAGAGGLIGLQSVLSAPKDGYTLALVVPATMITLPLTNPNFKIVPAKDLEPITLAVETHLTLVASPALGVKTLPEFASYAKKNEGKLNYGTPGAGTSFHFGNIMMAQKLGFKATHIPYQGEVQFLNDVAAGQLQFALVSNVGKPFIDGGKVVALASTGPKRSTALPQVATFTEQGVDFTTDGWVGYAAPSGTPPDILDKLNQAMVKVLQSPDIHKRLTDMGYSVVGNSREKFRSSVQESYKRYEEVVKSGEVKIEK